MTINQGYIDKKFRGDRDIALKMHKYGCSIEKCYNMTDFLLLTKHDFEREKCLRRRMVGKHFKNHDNPQLTRCYLRAITIGQTFNDDIFCWKRHKFYSLG